MKKAEVYIGVTDPNPEFKNYERLEENECVITKLQEMGIAINISKFQRDRAIEFGIWYSGMEKEKVEAAYDRFLKETKNT